MWNNKTRKSARTQNYKIFIPILQKYGNLFIVKCGGI